MPRYLKDTKIEYWTKSNGYVDDEGVFHNGELQKVIDLWANFKGKDFTEFYATNATWAEPVFVATITRPDFEIVIGDYVKHNDKLYEIKAIDDLTGHLHSDMKLTVQYASLEQE